jgi:predicted O-linked N-acetylglucosamine transferase (SPINDLY family)
VFEEAVALHRSGRFSEARFLCLKILEQIPEDTDALHLLGIMEIQRNNVVAALELFERAVKGNPLDGAVLNSLGNTQAHLRRYEEALASYDRVLALDPENGAALMNRGNVLQQLGRYEPALDCYERVLAIDPDNVETLINRGNVFRQLKRIDRAIESFSRGLEIEPDRRFLLGEVLRDKMDICDWTGLSRHHQRLAEMVRAGKKASPPFPALNTPLPAALQKRCSEIYVRELFPNNSLLPQLRTRYRHDRIRLGYFSFDFRKHAIAYQLSEVFERHDRTRFEVIAFSLSRPSSDAMSARLERAFDRFIDASGLPDKEVAMLARSLETDIAVDLNGFTAGGRTGVFAMRAAPIQVNYLGYPGTLAADYMDYIIADAMLVPKDETVHYREKVCWLPDTYFAADSRRPIGDTRTRADWGLPQDAFVFCCFNNHYKFTPEIFEIWMRLLKKIEPSVLWLSRWNEAAQANLRKVATASGVSPERLVFAPFVPSMDDHLARLRQADLFLDTLPYNAHSTACDALWAGLPVLTCLGKTFPGRVAASLLGAVGLPELVTNSLEGYEAMAAALAADRGKLIALKNKLAANRPVYPLFDTAVFTRHIESAFAAMWERHQAGLPPSHIRVPPAAEATGAD